MNKAVGLNVLVVCELIVATNSLIIFRFGQIGASLSSIFRRLLAEKHERLKWREGMPL